MNSNLFRKQLFGGLNSADVEEYIQNLEHEIESVKMLHQKEKNDILKKMEEYKEAAVAKPDPALQQQVDDLFRKLEQKEVENDRLKEECELLEKELKEHFLDSEEDGEKKWEAQNYELNEEKEALKKQVQDQATQIQELEQKLNEQQEKDKKQTEADPLFDYSVVTKLMEDANKNAETIRNEAKQEAMEILREADKEAEQRKSQIALRMNSQLEEKGIQLMAAKYKIEQYVKNINSLQQEMYNLYHRMNNMVTTMPVRLDDYWDGEHYEMLENNRLLAQQKEKKESEE